MYETLTQLFVQNQLNTPEGLKMLSALGFQEPTTAQTRLNNLCPNRWERDLISNGLPLLFRTISETTSPDNSLMNFERYFQQISDREQFLSYLQSHPRSVQILVKIFADSQFLTEILLSHPGYLQQLTQHKSLAEIKNRRQFQKQALQALLPQQNLEAPEDALKRFQRWELLRIGACDSFGLFDLKSVTQQLSFLADSLVQACLNLVSDQLKLDATNFSVIALGKLGGAELNYSSDIDLIFITNQTATPYWNLGQQLIQALSQATSEGFLYRVDMRLRPWGRSGPLVNSIKSFLSYLVEHAMHWEKQALLKARVIAGDLSLGELFLKQALPLIYQSSEEEYRQSILAMKQRIETRLKQQGKKWGQVKSGIGSIRDIEFLTQYFQLVYGMNDPNIHSTNTLSGLQKIFESNHLSSAEYHQLTNGYIFLRTVEHALQLKHLTQKYSLPQNDQELTYLAHRLGLPDSEQFLTQYQQYCESIRAIFEKYLAQKKSVKKSMPLHFQANFSLDQLDRQSAYTNNFSSAEIQVHNQLLGQLSDKKIIALKAESVENQLWKMTLVGYDDLGILSMTCGLLFVYGFDIVDGNVFTGNQILAHSQGETGPSEPKKFITVLTLKPPLKMVLEEVWNRYQQDLTHHIEQISQRKQSQVQGELAKRVANALRSSPEPNQTFYPLEIEVDNQTSTLATILRIRSENTAGFLYEFSNALALVGMDPIRVIIRSLGDRIYDTFYVTDSQGFKITDDHRLTSLKTTILLIKHFTHLLPGSVNPEAALIHFREFVQQLLEQPNSVEKLASLDRPEVLSVLAQFLGISDFLWEDFLRLQHENLFPVLKNVQKLASRVSKDELETQLKNSLKTAENFESQKKILNSFKDREMFRIDMRHLSGKIQEFGQFSAELTDLVEVILQASYECCEQELQQKYGTPLLKNQQPCPFVIAALGKTGGRELGYASDIELLFLYQENGLTSAGFVPDSKAIRPITFAEYFQKLVNLITTFIEAKQEGIFQIDLRLRPYGSAGMLAVSLEAFDNYYAQHGPAWPYERQAMVKLRPIVGSAELAEQIIQRRDQLIYTQDPFDITAMRAIREKQIRQLVPAGTINVKLSPGCLVDLEYLVQGLQITYGAQYASIRKTNTCAALKELNQIKILSSQDYQILVEAYIFQRRLIDALRMVRGHAKDLTIPTTDSEEFEFLARRLKYQSNPLQLINDLEKYTQHVLQATQLLEQLK